jgi:hypothetical protein
MVMVQPGVQLLQLWLDCRNALGLAEPGTSSSPPRRSADELQRRHVEAPGAEGRDREAGAPPRPAPHPRLRANRAQRPG